MNVMLPYKQSHLTIRAFVIYFSLRGYGHKKHLSEIEM